MTSCIFRHNWYICIKTKWKLILCSNEITGVVGQLRKLCLFKLVLYTSQRHVCQYVSFLYSFHVIIMCFTIGEKEKKLNSLNVKQGLQNFFQTYSCKKFHVCMHKDFKLNVWRKFFIQQFHDLNDFSPEKLPLKNIVPEKTSIYES